MIYSLAVVQKLLWRIHLIMSVADPRMHHEVFRWENGMITLYNLAIHLNEPCKKGEERCTITLANGTIVTSTNLLALFLTYRDGVDLGRHLEAFVPYAMTVLASQLTNDGSTAMVEHVIKTGNDLYADVFNYMYRYYRNNVRLRLDSAIEYDHIAIHTVLADLGLGMNVETKARLRFADGEFYMVSQREVLIRALYEGYAANGNLCVAVGIGATLVPGESVTLRLSEEQARTFAIVPWCCQDCAFECRRNKEPVRCIYNRHTDADQVNLHIRTDAFDEDRKQAVCTSYTNGGAPIGYMRGSKSRGPDQVVRVIDIEVDATRDHTPDVVELENLFFLGKAYDTPYVHARKTYAKRQRIDGGISARLVTVTYTLTISCSLVEVPVEPTDDEYD